MQRDSGAGDGTPGTPSPTHGGRLRHRKRSSEVLSDVNKTNGANLLLNDQNKYKSMLVRTYSSLWMIAGFVFLIYMGHLYIWAMVVVIQIFMAKELFNLLRKANEDRQLPGFRMLNWHFFFTAMLFTYGRFLSRQLVNTMTSDKLLYKLVSGLIKYQMFICYFLYIADKLLYKLVSGLIKYQMFICYFLYIAACEFHGPFSVVDMPKKAPFGGFFASGFKRAFKFKDFGDSIPGHGGFTDRMDCQMVMAVFAYIYYQSFVMVQDLSVETILEQILRNLTVEEQHDLYGQLGRLLARAN
nr:unnamed protein product [Digitaria exilis]